MPRPGTPLAAPRKGNGLDRLLPLGQDLLLPWMTARVIPTDYRRFRRKVGISRSSLFTEGKDVDFASPDADGRSA